MDFLALGDTPVRIACNGGGDLFDAATAHLAVSMPPKQLWCAYDNAVYFKVSYSHNQTQTVNGIMTPPEGPGFGVQINMDVLGKPVFSI